MVNLTINNKKIQVPEGTTILAAASSPGIKIPILCYLKETNEIGACRVCVVEVEGKETLVASCNTAVEEGNGCDIQTATKRACPPYECTDCSGLSMMHTVLPVSEAETVRYRVWQMI